MSGTAPEPVQFPNEQRLELTTLSIRQHRIKRWTRTLRAALTFVTVFLHNLKAALFGESSQIVQLQIHALSVIQGGDSAIQRCFLHFLFVFRGLPPLLPFLRAAARLALDLTEPPDRYYLQMLSEGLAYARFALYVTLVSLGRKTWSRGRRREVVGASKFSSSVLSR